MGVYYYRRTRTRTTSNRTCTHTHALTVAHTVALTPYSPERIRRVEQGVVAKARNRCTTRSSARMRNLRRQAHDTCQRGQKQAREGEGFRGQSEGSREVPMVRTPAGPLGSRTPSRGRSQRRDTGRGPAFRCVRISTQNHHQQQGRCAVLTAHMRMRT